MNSCWNNLNKAKKKYLIIESSSIINLNLTLQYDFVDKFNYVYYLIIMKFTVEKLPQAKNEIDSLEQSLKDMLEAD